MSPALSPTSSPSSSGIGPERLWASPVGSDLPFVLARANALSLAGTHESLVPFGLKVRSYSVLAIVSADTRPTQRELSEFLRLDPSQIVALVDELESRELVRRETDPSDRRAKVIVATDAGRALCAEARVAAREAEHGTFDALTLDERERLSDMLRLLATAPARPLAD